MSTSLEQNIVRRVRRIHFLRRVLGPTALKTYGLTVCTLALLSAVSVANVVANMPSPTAPAALGTFLVNALAHTELIVQLLLAGMCVAFGMLIRDAVRSVAGRSTQKLSYL